MSLTDTKAITIKYHHKIKGIFGREYHSETCYIYVEGFSDDTLAAEPDNAVEAVKKALTDMKKEGDRGAYMEICLETDQRRFSIDVDFDWPNGRKKTTFYLVEWQRYAMNYSVKDKASVDYILRKVRTFVESKGEDWSIGEVKE